MGRNYTYIAADFDSDKDAVEHLDKLRREGEISYQNAHDLQQSDDDSLNCSIKKSLKYRMDNSYRFVLIVGANTNIVTKGGCQLCESYNSYTKACAKGYSVDYRSFIKYECEKASEAGLEIIVFYKDTKVDRSLCPESVRWKGLHCPIKYRIAYGTYIWDDNAIKKAFRGV